MPTPNENDPVWEEIKRIAAQHRFRVYLPKAPNPNNFVQMPAERDVDPLYGKPRIDFTEFRRLQILQRCDDRLLSNSGLGKKEG